LRHRILPILLALLAIGLATGPAAGAAPAPHIGHVFVIVLENKGYAETFGPDSPAPYFARTLTRQGVLLSQYYGTAHYSLGNYLAMISGQGGTPETREDCEVFADFVASGTTPDGQAIGRGCVYPPGVRTLPGQLAARGLTWRGYMEDLGNDPAREAARCGAPALDAADPTQHAEAPSKRVPRGDQYAARHNPFAYFHSLTDAGACAAHVGGLGRLAQDLRRVRTTPAFTFITPNLCHDGHDAPCRNGEPGGLKSADAFLKVWVPRILASPAYREDGLLVITFDEADGEDTPLPGGRTHETFAGESCCGQQPGPNLGPFPQTLTDGHWTVDIGGFGGDRTGALLLSAQLAPGTVAATPFNHYAFLKTLEDLFDLGEHLGYAAQPGLVGFFEAGSDVRLRPAR
jgi:hypothetical protein